jgi:multidrug efflux pump subunit AcrA (membrane-fusion protein)
LETEVTTQVNHSINTAVNNVSVKQPLHSNETEMDEIISEKPSFIVRWGISLLFLVLLFLLVIAWFIQYPDIVEARGHLNSINAPKELIVHNSGKLVKLFAKEGQKVSKNEIVGYMESIADPEEVIFLSTYLDTLSILLESKTINQMTGALPAPFKTLGELQSPYQIFIQASTNFTNYLGNGFYLKKRMMLNNDMEYLKKLHSTLLDQKLLTEQDLALSDTTFKAQEVLNHEKVISAMDYRNERSKLIAKKISLPQILYAIINNESNQNEKLKEIAELENQIQQQKELFIQSTNTLKSQIEEWKRKYLIIAPIDGEINFLTFIQENQQLKQEQVLAFINPDNSSFYIEALIPQNNFGKVKNGQRVWVKFLAYPSGEFGKVKGQIEFISSISSDSGYLARLTLPEGLTTNYKRIIQYRTGLTVQIDIITNKRRLLERFFNNFRSKFD